MPNNDPNAYGATWFGATAAARSPRPRLTAEADVDVCVVGGGLAGLTVAREVARRGWSVLVLERNSVAWNASGRNLGFVLPGFGTHVEALVARVGLDHAKKLWALSEMGVDYVRNAIAEAGMPAAALTEGGWLRVSKTDRTEALAARTRLLRSEFGVAIDVWPVERVREELRSPLYFEAVHHPRAFSIHPLNYALGLAAAAEAAGARIHEDTAALQIDPIGVRKRVRLKDARVRAAHVVLAGNVHLGELMPQFAATLLPINRYVIVTEPVGRALRELIRFGGAVSDTDLDDNHYRVIDDDRLLWSGRSTVWHGSAERRRHALLRDIVRTYPPLRGLKAEYAWTATLGLAVHRMPQIGEISPGLWLLTGFGGQGLNTSAMGGELLARAIVEADTTWQLFNPFAMVWAGGTAGRVAAQSYSWASRGREQIDGWLARRRRGPGEIQGGTGKIVATPQFEPAPEPLAAAVPEPSAIATVAPEAVAVSEPERPAPPPPAAPEAPDVASAAIAPEPPPLSGRRRRRNRRGRQADDVPTPDDSSSTGGAS
jgi:glycine/D-amino acid oxidase-like deaminating enzyme